MSVTTDIQGQVARITLNNPDKRNAFDDIIIASLTEAFEKVGADPKTSTSFELLFCAFAEILDATHC